MTATNLAKAHSSFDRIIPTAAPTERENVLREEVEEMLREPTYPAARIQVAVQEVEKFIADMVAAPDPDLFLENTIGAFPRVTSHELGMHMAIARQWVANKEAVGEIIGPVFWAWARQITFTARAYGWNAEGVEVKA